MQIRIMGTTDEVADAVRDLGDVFEVASVSEPHANRAGDQVRVYVDATLCCPLCGRSGGYCGSFGVCQDRQE